MSFQVGDVLHGTHFVGDEHFSMLSLTVDQPVPAAGTAPAPSRPTSFPLAPTTGPRGCGSIDISLMAPCGYVVRLRAWDRIVSGKRQRLGGRGEDPRLLVGSLRSQDTGRRTRSPEQAKRRRPDSLGSGPLVSFTFQTV